MGPSSSSSSTSESEQAEEEGAPGWWAPAPWGWLWSLRQEEEAYLREPERRVVEDSREWWMGELA